MMTIGASQGLEGKLTARGILDMMNDMMEFLVFTTEFYGKFFFFSLTQEVVRRTVHSGRRLEHSKQMEVLETFCQKMSNIAVATL
jgi:hypothetical protein